MTVYLIFQHSKAAGSSDAYTTSSCAVCVRKICILESGGEAGVGGGGGGVLARECL